MDTVNAFGPMYNDASTARRAQTVAGCGPHAGGAMAMDSSWSGVSLERQQNYLAHRMSWLLMRGAIPHGLLVLHNCPGGTIKPVSIPNTCG